MSIFYKDQRLTHMGKGDAQVWCRFLDKYEKKYTHYEYDVRVGFTMKLGSGAPGWLAKSAEYLSQKRIDVVMLGLKNIYVVEVKLNAKASVIGDLIQYSRMYLTKFKPNKLVVPYLVTGSADPDLRLTLQRLRIPYRVV